MRFGVVLLVVVVVVNTDVRECRGSILAGAGQPVRRTEQGLVAGRVVGDVEVFLGVPYAQPPVGDLRFARPQPPTGWTGLRSADSFAPPCPQRPANLLPISEDCLYLNVYTPAATAPGGGGWPVMMWVHGGGYSQGSPQSYNGTRLAGMHNVVVVTISYRLGPFGWSLYECDTCTSNAGLYDQNMALQWISSNIAGFGGDPGRVTVFGESAGGGSALYHLMNSDPGSAALLHGAIAESPGSFWLPTRTRSLAASAEYARLLGCDSVECLRALPMDAFLKLPVLPWGGTMAFIPTVDGEWFQDQPLALLQKQEYLPLPLIIGWTAEEQNLLGLTDDRFTPPVLFRHDQYLDALVETFGNNTDDPNRLAPAVETYYADTAAELGYFQAYARAVADFCLAARCPSILDPGLSTASHPTYMYLFDKLPLSWIFQKLKCTHTCEIPYVMADPEAGGMKFDEDDWAFATLVSGMWASFARTQRPWNQWPDYRDGQNVLFLNTSLTVGPFPYNTTSCLNLARTLRTNGDFPVASVW
mmetsp:Transcript_15423/g.43723  ORF Transcript_15423/g.43723 Transcript_15423/m.43723 type:complete len:529 (+) Transcript_15423:45-1631(+)|eukprot:CAMPEP_0119123076 /NCGR_PEP_ID=MMETSP1310-20130426/3130_1 /TAXON_ID=464262 /ORGANISM="Genus nov. species nov., Strain RCC2339" /LENGTH=528 /DNA_ID=CAMNT_0007112825 /DNA_START=78 /DNA_END=1664 /DNA_ORIENTATION=+